MPYSKLKILVLISSLSFSFSNPAQASQEDTGRSVIVNCDKPLGPSQAGEALKFGGGLDYSGIMDRPDHPVLKAWQALGPKGITFEKLSTEEWWEISRNADGMIDIDFSEFDRKIRTVIGDLKIEPKNIYLYLGDVPKALSSNPQAPNFTELMPRDLKEWENFIRRIVAHNVEIGLKGVCYGGPGEPDCCAEAAGSWKMNFPEHVKLYAATYRGVKSADPTAQVGGPGTMSWQATKYTSNSPTLREWLRAFAAYNKKAPPEERVGLDYLAWQDYGWASDNLSDGAEVASRFLSENGLDPKTPKMLTDSGWGSWGEYGNGTSPHQHASYVMHNMIREFKNPASRRFKSTFYYTFVSDACNVNHEDPLQWQDGSLLTEVSLVNYNCWNDQLSLTPTYAAFQMVKAMELGQSLKTSAPEPLEAMAVYNPESASILVTVNNHAAEGAKTVLIFRNSPFSASTPKLNWTIQRIDQLHSRESKGGLEPEYWGEPLINSKDVRIPIMLPPFGTAQIKVSPSQENAKE